MGKCLRPIKQVRVVAIVIRTNKDNGSPQRLEVICLFIERSFQAEGWCFATRRVELFLGEPGFMLIAMYLAEDEGCWRRETRVKSWAWIAHRCGIAAVAHASCAALHSGTRRPARHVSYRRVHLLLAHEGHHMNLERF